MGVGLRRGLKATNALVFNLAEILLLDALRSWGRNRAAVAPAVGSAALVLLLVGVGEVGAVVLDTVAGYQAREASVLHVYVADDATAEQVSALRARLLRDPAVAS